MQRPGHADLEALSQATSMIAAADPVPEPICPSVLLPMPMHLRV